MSDTLIKVENVSKKFCRGLKRSLWYGMRDLGNELVGRRHGGGEGLRPEEFWAVHKVSFTLRRGECLGLIGRNGAGKTTLLRVLNGLIKPDTGSVELRGKVGALISLGAGFNPVLTGRENIYVNASVLGLSKSEIDDKVQEIVEFAELEECIDMPVQSFSSGMQMRLGFSIATAIKPDILFLDEVLAVGDARFQAKCYSRLADIKNQSAVVFVSHSMHSIARMADRVLLLERGEGREIDSVDEGIVRYLKRNREYSPSRDVRKEGTGKLSIEDVRLRVIDGVLFCGRQTTEIAADIDLCARKDVTFCLDFVFRNSAGSAVAECPSSRTDLPLVLMAGEKRTVRLSLTPVPLATGSYVCSLYALDINCSEHFHAWLDFSEICVVGDSKYTSPIQLHGCWN